MTDAPTAKGRTTDRSERGLERIVTAQMTGLPLEDVIEVETAPPPPEGLPGPTGWRLADPARYDRRWCLDLNQLARFLRDTQPEVADGVSIDADTPTRRAFLQRLKTEIDRRGTVDVLRRGLSHLGHSSIQFLYGRPSAGNAEAVRLNALNRFTVVRQLAYSEDETRRALDLGLFVNGLPIATMELKNAWTRQTVADAVEQYRRDRDPREPLLRFGRCVVHLAVDESQVRMCTELKGAKSWFLPFDKGVDDGAGNPPNPNGLATDYLWREVLTPGGLTDILERYVAIVEERDPDTEKTKRKQIFPRYHQLDAVRRILADAAERGAGHRYLIQHSAGSGKSNTIGWTAHQLVGLEQDGEKVFDSVIVVTDRRLLDRQIRDTIRQFAGSAHIVAAVEGNSGELRRFIEAGKKIIVSTVQKFPHILDEIGDAHRDRRYAVLIDEAHSSQSGRTAGAMAAALTVDRTGADGGAEDDPEDLINGALEARIAQRRLAPNASYFAFTATPKTRTLETFGIREEGAEGPTFRPFHHYAMKQAIEEGFILDVLRNYTPLASFYRLIKTVDDDPAFDVTRAQKKLRAYVEGNDHAIHRKAELMVDHFHASVARKIGGQARAMIVTGSIERAIRTFLAVRAHLEANKSPYKAIVAFSGKHDVGGREETEDSLNGFPSADIAKKVRTDPYRILVCADKFQTGYDEPLLHTMYVDKTLAGVQAVQTLSRLNRALHSPAKRDVFVLDFANDADAIKMAFDPFYRTTILSGETDPNKLHNMQMRLEAADVFTEADVEAVAASFLAGEGRERVIDPVIDRCRAQYVVMGEDEQVAFKGTSKAFLRAYDFLGSMMPHANVDWEKLSIFLTLLHPRLPSPISEDLSYGILESIDMESYRLEKREEVRIALADSDGTLEPPPDDGGGGRGEPELDRLSVILKTFNERFGTSFTDADRIMRRIAEEIAPEVAETEAVRNAVRHTPQNAQMESDKALKAILVRLLTDETELYKQFTQNEDFRAFLSTFVFDRVRKNEDA